MGYVNKESCLATGIALAVLAILAVSARITQRVRANRQLSQIRFTHHLDDLFCSLALVPATGTAVVLVYGAHVNVLGQHNDASHAENWITTTTPQLVLLEKFVYIIFVLQPLAIGFIKLSFLFFYRRVFFVYESFRIVSWILIAITSAWIAAFFLGFTFACGTSFETNWASLAEIGAKCGFGFMATVVFSILDAVLDFIILVLPLPWIWRLQMPTIRKLQACGMFMLGGFAVAAAIIRAVICVEQSVPSSALEKTTVMGMPPYDILGITGAGLFWTVVETNVALIACCLPTLGPLLSNLTAPIGTALKGCCCCCLPTARSHSGYSPSSVDKFNTYRSGNSDVTRGRSGTKGSETTASSREGLKSKESDVFYGEPNVEAFPMVIQRGWSWNGEQPCECDGERGFDGLVRT